MSYKVYKKRVAHGFAAEKKTGYVLRMRSRTTIRPEQLSEEMSRYMSAEGPEVLLAVNQLYALVSRQVSMGFSVTIDGLGTFYPKFSAKAKKTKDEVDASTIEKVAVGFRIDRSFQRELDEVKVEMDRSLELKHV